MSNNICRSANAQAILDTVKMTATIQDKTQAERAKWPRNEKFNCTISRNGKRARFSFFQSIAERANRPDKSEVLWSVAMDSSLVENDFESFCRGLDYDTDPRSALKTYNACKRNAKKLQKLFNEGEIIALYMMEDEGEN